MIKHADHHDSAMHKLKTDFYLQCIADYIDDIRENLYPDRHHKPSKVEEMKAAKKLSKLE
jgi:hypothetical protein